MSFKATITVFGEIPFNVRRFKWEVSQNTDVINRPDAYVQGGQLEVELDSRPSDVVQVWALDDTKKLDVTLKVYKGDDSNSVRKLIEFKDAYCVGLNKEFDCTGNKTSMIMTLKLSADKLIYGEMIINNEWPA